MPSQSGECCLHVIMMSHDLVPPPFVMPNTLHYGPAELRAAHVLYGGVQGSENSLADIHSVVYLARQLHRVAPHVPHSSLALMPGIL